jgi:hypothetical protein
MALTNDSIGDVCLIGRLNGAFCSHYQLCEFTVSPRGSREAVWYPVDAVSFSADDGVYSWHAYVGSR